MQVFGRYRYPTAVFALAIAAFAALLFLHAYKSPFLDLKAFYCAGHAFAHGADPYRDAALHPCELALGTGVFASSSGFDQPTVPVPWPPYAMPLLALLSAAPFNYAAATWTLLNFACLGIAAEVLRRALPQLSPVVIASFVLFAAVPTEAALGQPAGFELLAVAGAGWCVRLRSSAGIGIGLLFAAIQPYVALPLGVALLWSGAAARRAAGACVVLLAAGSMVLLERLTIEYVTVVAPEHARANALEITQLSFTSLLAAIGVPLEAARILGVFIYVASLAVGLWAGIRVASGTQRPEALPWIATMFATLGAPYLHFQQLVCALPGALVILSSAWAPRIVRIAAIGLFVPWIGLVLQTVYSYMIAPFAAPMAWSPQRRDRVLHLVVTAVVLFCFDLAVSAWFRNHVTNPSGYRSASLTRDALAEDSWRGFIAVQWASLGVSSLGARALTGASSVSLAFVTVVVAARSRLSA